MAKDNLLTIRELLQQANRFHDYDASSIAKKKFGNILTYNKVLKVNPLNSIVEVSMMIKGLTDMIDGGLRKRPVAAHRVRLRIKGASNEEVTGAQLVERIREEHPELSDKKKFPNADILEEARKGKEFLKGKVIMEVNRVILEEAAPTKLVDHGDGTGSYEKVPSKWTFAIIDKEISPNCKIQVKCSCSSYFWTFQYANAKHSVDIGGERAMKSYDNYNNAKVKRNPDSRIGVCKHLMLLLGMLIHDRVISEVEKSDRDPGQVYSLNIENFRSLNRKNREAFKNLVREYKHDLRQKKAARNARYYRPKTRKRSKRIPVPKGTMGFRGRRRKK